MSRAGKWAKIWEKAIADCEKEAKKVGAKVDPSQADKFGKKLMMEFKKADKVCVTSAIADKTMRGDFAIPLTDAMGEIDNLSGRMMDALKKLAAKDPQKAKAQKVVLGLDKMAALLGKEIRAEIKSMEAFGKMMEKRAEKSAKDLTVHQKNGTRIRNNMLKWIEERRRDDDPGEYNKAVEEQVQKLIDFATTAMDFMPDPKKQAKPVDKGQRTLKKFKGSAVLSVDIDMRVFNRTLDFLTTQTNTMVKEVGNLKPPKKK
ncbi:MAG: hypothetical protein AAF393_15660 [Pseudomonadota bacterium]